jgi:hypothetical protein
MHGIAGDAGDAGGSPHTHKRGDVLSPACKYVYIYIYIFI